MYFMDGMDVGKTDKRRLHVNSTECVLSDFPTVFARSQQEFTAPRSKIAEDLYCGTRQDPIFGLIIFQNAF